MKSQRIKIFIGNTGEEIEEKINKFLVHLESGRTIENILFTDTRGGIAIILIISCLPIKQ